jgi:hypothetical protein
MPRKEYLDKYYNPPYKITAGNGIELEGNIDQNIIKDINSRLSLDKDLNKYTQFLGERHIHRISDKSDIGDTRDILYLPESNDNYNRIKTVLLKDVLNRVDSHIRNRAAAGEDRAKRALTKIPKHWTTYLFLSNPHLYTGLLGAIDKHWSGREGWKYSKKYKDLLYAIDDYFRAPGPSAFGAI